MASIKISELEEVTELSNSDVLPIINDNETKKISINKLDERYASAEDFENIKTIENGEIFLIELPKLPYGGTGGSWLMKRELTERQQQMIIDTFNYCLQNNIKYPILKVTSTAETVTASGSNFFYLNTPIPTPKHNVGTTLNFTSIGTKQTDNGAMAVCELSITLLYDEDNGYWLNPSGTVLYIVNSSDKIVTTNYAKENYLNKTNTTEYTPTAEYHPATKKYVDEAVANAGAGGGDVIDLSNVLTKDNTEEFTPDGDYEPATKKYVDDAVSGAGVSAESEQRYIRLTGGYNFFSGWLQSYPTFNGEDLAAISEYVTKYYKNDDLKSLLPLTIINNKVSTSAPLSQAQVITINNIYDEFGTIFMEGIIYKNNSDQRDGCFSDIYGVSIMLLSYTWEDGVFTCTRAGFRNAQISGYLTKTNTTAYTPTADYHPATKKYVDDTVAAGGGSGGGTNTPKSAIYQLNTTKYLSIPSTYTNEDMLATISEAFTKYFNGETGIPTFRLTAADSMCLNPDYYFILYQLNGLNATYYAHKLYNSYSIKGYSPTLYIVKMDFTLTNTDGVYTTTGVNVSYMTQGEMLLLSTNTKQYTPTSDYNPATKKYVDDAISTAITTVLGGEY